MTTITVQEAGGTPQSQGLHRAIGWKDAFWVASGVPALVLFSIGGIAATVGTPSVLVWTLSVMFGFIQAFTYAEIAGLFPNKSGGASVYGAAAWVRYSKYIAPRSVWCNWLAWTPHRRGLYPQRPIPARGGDQDLGNPAARPRFPEGGAEAPAQLDVLHRRDPDRHLLRHP